MVSVVWAFVIAFGICFGAFSFGLIADAAMSIIIEAIKTLTKRVFWDE